MPDRSLRLRTFPPRPAQGGERGAVLLRERPASPPKAPQGGQNGDGRDDGQQNDNPFAPPPEGTPDRPWQPRRPEESGDSGSGSGGGHGSGGPWGGPGGGGSGGGSPWGSQWSDRQPGRSSGGGFGERPGGGPQGSGGGPAGSGMRWDPTDPAQRRARYALLSGMWAVFFALFSWPYVALLLGVLALYWGISALRAKPRTPSPEGPAPTPAGRPQVTSAVGGLVTASLALVLVASTFTVQFVYRDYYTCVTDALTHEAKQSCDSLLPKQLRGVLGTGDS
ncbi:hypothetical protein [Streptomyces sp. MMG1121]|uniref:hypothetical protein n=1 Tax=Streptomyces sp. MMG1121 TaxID=1415544 RepID=UPI0006AF110E|nr:hypothetical protein [Streptomyces sp. MMG1121]KOV67190.1 membrane protein [Streptomyces sp. MMG1121]